MGQDWRPNLALSTELILVLLEQIKDKASEAQGTADDERLDWLVYGTYITVTYVLSLRGTEGLLLDLEGLRKHQNMGGDNYIIIALRGKVKGEHADRCHLLPCCKQTGSGILVQQWIEELIHMKERYGQTTGPAISDTRGVILSTQHLDFRLVSTLEEIFDSEPELFPAKIRLNKEEIGTSYQVFRSLRRASDTRAIEQNVLKTDIDMINRWHSIEQSKGNRPFRPMYQHYAQVELLVKPYIRYTSAM
jgi:hypothetical protein